MSEYTQAFPVYERFSGGAGPLDLSDPGMSLRDYFAGQVICGLMARAGAPDPVYESKLAYQVADAMMAERAAHQPTKEAEKP